MPASYYCQDQMDTMLETCNVQNSDLLESLREALSAVVVKRQNLIKLSDYVAHGLMQTLARNYWISKIPASSRGQIITVFRGGVYPCFTAEEAPGHKWLVTCHDENFVSQLATAAMELMQKEARTLLNHAQESFHSTLFWPGEQFMSSRGFSRQTLRECPNPFKPEQGGDYYAVKQGVACHVTDYADGLANAVTVKGVRVLAEFERFLQWNNRDGEPVLTTEQKTQLIQEMVDSHEGWFPYALQREHPNAAFGVMTLQQFTKGTFRDSRIAVVVGNYDRTLRFLRGRTDVRCLLPGQLSQAKALLEEFGAVAIGNPT